MNRDKVEGAAKDMAGRVQRKAGQAADDPAMAARGAAKQAEGKVQKGLGAVRDAVRRDRDDPKTSSTGGGTGRKGAL